MKQNSARSVSGLTLVELMTALAIAGIVLSAGIPSFFELRHQQEIAAATQEIESIFHLARSKAISRGRHFALKFRESAGAWQYAIFEDGDFDGVRNDDIDRGTDPMVQPFRVVLPQTGSPVRIGLLPHPVPDPDRPARPLGVSSPIRFNRSTLCSFSPYGSSTPGSIFLTDGVSRLAMVRVYGTTAKIRAIAWVPARQAWVSR